MCPAVRDDPAPVRTINLSFEKDGEGTVKVVPTVPEGDRNVAPFSVVLNDPNAIEWLAPLPLFLLLRNMTRIMYFQSGIGASQQRLKLPDGRLVQLDGPDAEKSLAPWLQVKDLGEEQGGGPQKCV